jgi:hypothetical protein
MQCSLQLQLEVLHHAKLATSLLTVCHSVGAAGEESCMNALRWRPSIVSLKFTITGAQQGSDKQWQI